MQDAEFVVSCDRLTGIVYAEFAGLVYGTAACAPQAKSNTEFQVRKVKRYGIT
jgi:hypothetical protein